MKTGEVTVREYADACADHDADHPGKKTRLHWGDGPDWTRGAPSYDESVGARKLR